MDCTLTLIGDAQPAVFSLQTSASHALQVRAPAGQATSPPAAQSPSGPTTVASPLEVMLSGATACSAYDILHLLQERGIPVTALTVHAQAERASSVPRVFTHIHLHYRIQAPQASLEAIPALVDLSVTERCSALNMLKHTARIDTSIELLPSA